MWDPASDTSSSSLTTLGSAAFFVLDDFAREDIFFTWVHDTANNNFNANQKVIFNAIP